MTPKRFIDLTSWFIRSSREYLAGEHITRRSWVGAWARFMWYCWKDGS